MTLTICELCNGEGIIGAGDYPIQKNGPLSTCGDCNGTGKVGTLEEINENTMDGNNEETVVTPEVTEETSFLEESSDVSTDEVETTPEE